MELLNGPGLLICGFLISFFMLSMFMAARKGSRKASIADIAEPEKILFSYHYSAMYKVPNGTANHDGVMITDKKIKTFEQCEQCEKLKKDISPDNAHKMTITSLSFLGLVKEE